MPMSMFSMDKKHPTYSLQRAEIHYAEDQKQKPQTYNEKLLGILLNAMGIAYTTIADIYFLQWIETRLADNMARGHQKEQSKAKNAKKQEQMAKQKGHSAADQKKAAAAALIHACTVCRVSTLHTKSIRHQVLILAFFAS